MAVRSPAIRKYRGRLPRWTETRCDTATTARPSLRGPSLARDREPRQRSGEGALRNGWGRNQGFYPRSWGCSDAAAPGPRIPWWRLEGGRGNPGNPRSPCRGATQGFYTSDVTPSADASRTRFHDERQRKRGRRISHMFDKIAPTYDLLNHVLSANIDKRWRDKAVSMLALDGSEDVLDACTGTGDLAIALRGAASSRVTGTDFAPEMLSVAREKKGGEHITWEVADTTALPFDDASFDVATVSFGVRNLEDLDAGFRDLGRVLRPGGRLLVLEFSRPPNPIFRAIYNTYFMLILPMIGNIVSGGADNAYTYLPRSVMAFPGPDALAERMKNAGFAKVEMVPLTFGIAYIHLATKAG